jgi:hypothetical protein
MSAESKVARIKESLALLEKDVASLESEVTELLERWSERGWSVRFSTAMLGAAMVAILADVEIKQGRPAAQAHLEGWLQLMWQLLGWDN